MINVTIIGNIYDESNTLINCYYDVYYIRQNVLVTGLTSELNQYNFNIGSSNHLTQNGDLKDNDVILIRFNTKQNILDYSGKFCSIAIIYNSESIINSNVQLKNISIPACKFDITRGNLNEVVTINVDTSLDNSWIYDNNIMYQRNFLYGYEIFPNLLTSSTDVSYNFDGFWISSNSFIYTTFGDKTIMYKILLPDNNELDCSKTIRIYKNEPVITYTIPNVLIMNSDIDISIGIIDIDSTIVNVKHFFNNILITENTNLSNTYNITLDNQISYYRTELTWNNGFEDILLIEQGQIEIQNQKPTVSPVVEYINNTKNNLKIVPHAIDPENSLDFVRYKIYIRKETIFEITNEVDYTWVYLDTLESNILDLSVFVDFYKSGNFKIEVQAFDKGGLYSDISDVFVDIVCSTKDTCTGYFDWSKTTSMLKFKMEEETLKFKIEESALKFKINEETLKFKIQEEIIKFKMEEETIKFSLNCGKI